MDVRKRDLKTFFAYTALLWHLHFKNFSLLTLCMMKVALPREKEMATHSSVLAWRILWTEEPGGPLSIRSHRVRHDWSNWACMHAGEGNGSPLQYSCLENPSCCLWGCRESDTTEVTRRRQQQKLYLRQLCYSTQININLEDMLILGYIPVSGSNHFI